MGWGGLLKRLDKGHHRQIGAHLHQRIYVITVNRYYMFPHFDLTHLVRSTFLFTRSWFEYFVIRIEFIEKLCNSCNETARSDLTHFSNRDGCRAAEPFKLHNSKACLCSSRGDRLMEMCLFHIRDHIKYGFTNMNTLVIHCTCIPLQPHISQRHTTTLLYRFFQKEVILLIATTPRTTNTTQRNYTENN